MQVMTTIKGQLPSANRTVMLNPFPPKTDELLISPYNITPDIAYKRNDQQWKELLIV